MRAFGTQLPDRERLVLGAFGRSQHVRPAAVDALVDEDLRAGVPERAAERERCGSRSASSSRRSSTRRSRPSAPRRSGSRGRPRCGASRPAGPASARRSARRARSEASRISHQLRTFSQKAQNGKPSRSSQSRQYCRIVARRRPDRRADAPGRVVQRRVPARVRIRVVVVEAPDDVARVAADVEVLRAWREDERVDREVRLEEAALRLRFDGRELLLPSAARADPATATAPRPRVPDPARRAAARRSAASRSSPTSRRSRSTMSSSRKRSSFQIVESKWWLCSSRVLRGQRVGSVIVSTSVASK